MVMFAVHAGPMPTKYLHAVLAVLVLPVVLVLVLVVLVVLAVLVLPVVLSAVAPDPIDELPGTCCCFSVIAQETAAAAPAWRSLLLGAGVGASIKLR